MADQDIRWRQAQELMRENALDVATMAACLGQEEDRMLAMLGEKPTRKITDAVAAQMEQTFSKPKGWLDQSDDGGITFDLFGA
jgi:plasmid maintenance system antidote protein VapI